jgi:RHS repeat-associated protein
MGDRYQRLAGLLARVGLGAASAAFMAVGIAVPAFGAEQTGVDPQVVKLPAGPGSIQGLGDTFEPGLSTGTAEYAYEFAMPSAPLVPSFTLEYNGGNGDGPIGIGWELGIPYVQRGTGSILPHYVDTDNGVDDNLNGEIDEFSEKDRFASELHQYPSALVENEDGYYLGETEGPFIRYEKLAEHWEATKPDGTRIVFGETPQARIVRPDLGATFTWRIERETSPEGNTVQYFYETIPGDENLNNSYLSRVEYGAGPPPWDSYHFVVFQYEARPGFIENCTGGFQQRTGVRLKEVLACTQGVVLDGHASGDFNADGVTDYLNHRYVLAYDADPFWTLLSSITEYGADNVSALPPVSFEYTLCNPPDVLSAAPGIVGSPNAPRHLFTSDSVEITELNGDGLPDLLRTFPEGGAHIGYLNLGDTGSGPDRRINWSGPVPIGGDPRVYTVSLAEGSGAEASLADYDGDGRSDLGYRGNTNEIYYFPNVVADGLPEWGERLLMNPDPAFARPPSPIGNDNVLEIDMNGDAQIDIAQSLFDGQFTQIRVWFNAGGERYSQPILVDTTISYEFKEQGVDLVDFNGDDVDDFVRITTTSVEVAPGLGWGRFGDIIDVPIPDIDELNFVQVRLAAMEDVTSSALPDLLVEGASVGELWYWINRGDYTFDKRRVIRDTPTSIGGNTAARWADLNGNGTSDYVFADDLADPRLQIIDIGEILGCVPSPNLLKRIDNGLGAVTTLEYKTSTAFQLPDTDGGAAWQDPVPFPVDVLTGVTVSDSRGHEYTRTYAYHDGYYSFDWLQFIGFREIEEQHLSDDSTAPALTKRFTYDVGYDVFPLRGSLLREIWETADGEVFWDEETAWDTIFLWSDPDENEAVFPHMISKTRDVLEQGNGTPQRIVTEYEYDEYGNQTVLREYGVVDGDDVSALNDERITTTEYAVNSDSWIIRLPARTEISNLDGDILSRTEYYYDDETFSGANLGEVVLGQETMVRDWRDPADPDAHVTTSRAKYDAYGNAFLLLDPLAVASGGIVDETAGHLRRIDYDTHFNHFPVRETIVLGGGAVDLTIEADYDPGFGKVVAARDFNGNETRYGYDPFARLSRSIRPGATDAFPSMEYEYGLGVAAAGGIVNYVETRLLDTEPGDGDRSAFYAHSRSYMDGLGRTLQERREAEPSSDQPGSPRAAVTQAAQFNGRGKTASMLQPFFSTVAGSSLDDVLAFEDIEHAAWTGRFHIDGALETRTLATAPKTQTEYDATIRVTRAFNPDGTFRESRYEPLVTITLDENDVGPDPLYSETPVKHYKDGLGRLVQTDEITRTQDNGAPADALQTWTSRYEWRHDGQLKRLIDAQGNEKWFEYDGLGRKTLLNDMNQGISFFTYDDAGNLASAYDILDYLITYTYDGANRLRTEDFHDEGEVFSTHRVYDPALPISADNLADVNYFYDAPAGVMDLGNGSAGTAQNTLGELAYVWDNSGESHFSYDARGNTTWTVRRLPDPATELLVSFKTEMNYDQMDRVTSIIYPDEDRLAYSYNERNLLESITGGLSSTEGGIELLHNTTYAPSEQRIATSYGDGVNRKYAYDTRGRLESLRATPSGQPDEPILDYAYTYDAVSNITEITDNRPATTRPAGDPRRNTQRFKHDSMYRLGQVIFSRNMPGEEPENDGQILYRYDRIGNMLSKNADFSQEVRGHEAVDLGNMSYGGSGGAANRIGRAGTEGPGPHALTQVGEDEDARIFEYDHRGNMTKLDDLQMSWDLKDRLAIVEDGSSFRAEYVYDYADQRVIKRVWQQQSDGTFTAAPTKVTLYAGRHFELRDNGQPTKYVYHGDSRLAKITGSIDTTSERVQRISLLTGWNVMVIAVQAADIAAQLGITVDVNLSGAFLWDAVAEDVIVLDGASEVPAGSVIWLYANSPAVKTIKGTYAPTDEDEVLASQGYLPFVSLDRINLAASLPESVETAWGFNPSLQDWQARVPGELAFLSDLPSFVLPGQPVYLMIDGEGEVQLPNPADRIQYYHGDHLGSANLVTNAEGDILEETTFFPFGELRNQWKASAEEASSPNHYLFSEKERDEETTLQYFEARYLAAPLGRFNRVDPLVEEVPEAAMEDPQLLHAYAYARNNPIVMSDPDGRFVVNPAGRVLQKQLNPFSDQKTGNFTDTKAERRARVFGELKFKKGEKFPTVGAPELPKFLKSEAEKLSKEERLSPNALLSSLTQVSDKLASKFPSKGKNALDAAAFTKGVTVKSGKIDPQKLLGQFGVLRTKADLQNSPITAGGKVVDERITKQIERLQDTVKSIDLNAKYSELLGKVNKSGKAEFQFDQKQVDAFIDKYLDQKDDAEAQNRNKKKEDSE